MRYSRVLWLITIGLTAGIMSTQVRADDTDEIMALIEAWFGGVYDNSAQVAADEAHSVPEDKRQISLHQVVERVVIDGFDGLTYYQQLTNDGTTGTLLGIGIYQFRPDPESGRVQLRLHIFNDAERFVDAHLDAAKLESVTPSDVHATQGCEFYFSKNADGSQLKGVMGEPGCYPISRSTGKKMHHVDELIIRPGELWNNARYYDLEGNQLFGNVTGEYAKQIRIAD